MCKSVNIFVFWSYQCCPGALIKSTCANVFALHYTMLAVETHALQTP